MSTLLIVGITIILVIAVLLLVLLLKINSKDENIEKSSDNGISKGLLLNDILLPKKISQIDHFSLSKASKQVFESFKALDYASKPSAKLDKIEWHTWQVSLLIAMIKAKKGFFVPSNDSLFHEVILSSTKNSIVETTQRIIDKYNNHIDINKSRDELSQDILWSSKEVSILFYYMSKN